MANKIKIQAQELIIPNRSEAFRWSKGSCKPMNLTLDKATRDRLERLCQEHKTSKSAIVRAAIDVLSK